MSKYQILAATLLLIHSLALVALYRGGVKPTKSGFCAAVWVIYCTSGAFHFYLFWN